MVADNEALNRLQRLRLIARPVVFATDVESAPFSILGTAFFVGYRGHLFILTARHVLRGWPPSKVLIFPAAGAKKAIGITQHWNVHDGGLDPEADSSDLFIFQPTLNGVPAHITRKARVLALDRPGLLDWFEPRFSSTFYAFGYPRPLNSVDYEASTIHMAQVFMAGHFIGHSIADEVYELRLDNPHALDDFAGLSGAPVFSLENAIARQGTQHFCGIAIRGGAAEGRMHFLSSQIIKLALDDAAESIEKTTL